MSIPKLHYISQGNTPGEHLKNIEMACMQGASLVQLRLKNISTDELLKTAIEARKITRKCNTALIINDHYKIAKEANADGVHLGKNDCCPSVAKSYLGESFIIGGTANTAIDCVELIRKKVDYIGLGPFRFTRTKTHLSPILGCNGYLSIVNELKTSTPIIAIGGITVDDVSGLLETGVYGVAVSGEITKDFNNIDLFNKQLNALSTYQPEVYR